jgi:hypothetical protein
MGAFWRVAWEGRLGGTSPRCADPVANTPLRSKWLSGHELRHGRGGTSPLRHCTRQLAKTCPHPPSEKVPANPTHACLRLANRAFRAARPRQLRLAALVGLGNGLVSLHRCSVAPIPAGLHCMQCVQCMQCRQRLQRCNDLASLQRCTALLALHAMTATLQRSAAPGTEEPGPGRKPPEEGESQQGRPGPGVGKPDTHPASFRSHLPLPPCLPGHPGRFATLTGVGKDKTRRFSRERPQRCQSSLSTSP